MRRQNDEKAAGVRPGRFRHGHDPRRHRFTREECSHGLRLSLFSSTNLKSF